MAWSCSLFYTLVTLYFGKGLTKRMETACTEGVKPMRIFPFSSCALVAKQQHFNCDWYKQLGFNGNLSRRFKPSFYWCNLQLAGFVTYWERKKGNKTDWCFFFPCPVCSSTTCSGVCFSICFPHSEINKLGIKIKSANPNQSTVPASPPEVVGKVMHNLFVCRASVVSKSKGYTATPANTSTRKLKQNWWLKNRRKSLVQQISK